MRNLQDVPVHVDGRVMLLPLKENGPNVKTGKNLADEKSIGNLSYSYCTNLVAKVFGELFGSTNLCIAVSVAPCCCL